MSPAKDKQRQDSFKNASGSTLETFYRPEDLGDWNPEQGLGFPGEYPFTRGIYPTQSRSHLWTMRQYAGYGTALESNARGLDVDSFAPRLSFFLNAHNDLLEEVAKFRAARRLWSRTMRERSKAQNPRSWMFRFHTQTAGSTLAAQQPDVNLVRVTLPALPAILGGTQSVHTNARDEALPVPAEASALLALRTQQIIAHESGIANTVDPLAGSSAIEKLTNEVEPGAEDYLRKIDAVGGMLRAVETGYVQREIQQAAYERQKEVESGERVVVGVNRYASEEKALLPVLRIDPEVKHTQVERLRKLRARRDAARVASALKQVEETAGTEQNLMPAIIGAVKAYATVGEISDALGRVFGEYQESVVIRTEWRLRSDK